MLPTSTRARALLWLLVAGTLLIAACSSDDAPSTAAAAPTPTVEGDDAPVELEPDDTELTVSYARDVHPVITETCARCHTGSGPGTPHLLLETVDDVSDSAFAIAANIDIGAMPPWPASDHSVAFQNDWSLADDQVAAIVAWQQAGAPIDVDPDTPIEAVDTFALETYDVELAPTTGGYDGEAGQPDEYRCLIYDPQLTEDAWLEAFEFVPDQTEVVHHAIGYLIPGDLRDRAEARDGEDGQPGWSCFGSSGLGEDDIFLGWAPGQGPTELPTDTGMSVEAGDFIVVQIHYHFEIDSPEDQSTLRLRWSESADPDEIVVVEFFAPAEIPCSPDEQGPLCDRDAAIADAIAKYGPEGVQGQFITGACGYTPDDFVLVDNKVSGSCDQPVGEGGQIIAVLGHAHEIGSSFRMTLNPDSASEQLLLDIDRWDFDWQYNYYPVDEIMISGSDWVRLECTWDRSLRDPDLEPAYIVWADGTDDEMCFGTMMIRLG